MINVEFFIPIVFVKQMWKSIKSIKIIKATIALFVLAQKISTMILNRLFEVHLIY